MVAPIYSNRKGIYKDLYREIDADNKKKKSDIDSNVKKNKKGIYVELYRQIEFKNNESKNDSNNLYALAFKKLVKDIFSNISYFFSSASIEIKPLILACMVAKKPINDYIGNSLHNINTGLYYNDR